MENVGETRKKCADLFVIGKLGLKTPVSFVDRSYFWLAFSPRGGEAAALLFVRPRGGDRTFLREKGKEERAEMLEPIRNVADLNQPMIFLSVNVVV